jgi:hypothetical protein
MKPMRRIRTMRRRRRIKKKMTASREDLEFMFWHFEGQAYDFPRRITTLKSNPNGKIRSGGQFPVNSIDEILRAYDRAEHKECRLAAYPYDLTEQLRILPDVIFIDIDSHDESDLSKVKRRLKSKLVTANPTINDSGRGFHVIQPVDASSLLNLPVPEWFAEAENKGWSGFYKGFDNELQGFYGEHLGKKGEIADGSNNPSILSCLIRPPGTINAKVSSSNNKEVTIVKSWDGKRPSIELILGDFISDRLQKYNEQKRAENERLAKGVASLQQTNNYYDYYVPIILNTPLPDWREHTMAKVIVPYLLTFKQLPEDQVYTMTENWLKACNELRPLNFDYSEIWTKIRYTRARKRIPMGKAKLLYEMSCEAEPQAYEILKQKLNPTNYSQTKKEGGEQ